MKKNGSFILILIFSLFARTVSALDYTDVSSALTNMFESWVDENEGTTGFRSLLIPMGGRSESMGAAYTGLSDDISYIDYNPAASSILEQTEIAVFHNSWIADSNMETLAGTIRFGNFGIGSKISCFYVPFTEYDSFGSRVTGSYYSETTGVINAAYNICPGYTFKGLAVGINAKVAWRHVPDYTDNDSGEIISGSGSEQSAVGIMGDLGLMFQFNFFKLYNSRDANFRIGFSATNLGAAITGFGSSNGLKMDDPLPSSVGIGASYKPFRPLTFTAEARLPINLFDILESHRLVLASGVCTNITDFFSILAGFQIKGANPKFSLGGEFDISKMRLNANYTLDLTSSLNPVNRFSLSAKLRLGDRGRKAKQDEVYELYNEGIYFFAQKNYDAAIEKWNATLSRDKYFDPARTGIKIAKEYSRMLSEMGSISNSSIR